MGCAQCEKQGSNHSYKLETHAHAHMLVIIAARVKEEEMFKKSFILIEMDVVDLVDYYKHFRQYVVVVVCSHLVVDQSIVLEYVEVD